MLITLLSHNLSSNALGRAFVLYEMLKKEYDVEIAGPILWGDIWEPLRTTASINFVELNPKKFSIDLIKGDVVYAIKPKPITLKYGLACKYLNKKKLVIDVDDWELGFLLDKKIEKGFDLEFTFIEMRMHLMEQLVKLADSVTVSSSFLQNRFGGVIVPHAKNTKLIDPEKYSGNLSRKAYGINLEDKIIMFLGTLRKHKGVDTILEALDFLQNPKIKLVIVGADLNKDPFVKEFRKKNRPDLILFGKQPIEKIPEFLSMADIVVLPQNKTNVSLAQVPSKIFDALCMGKPVITSNISDLPVIVKGCGSIIQSGNAKELSEKIDIMFKDDKKLSEMSKIARNKCETHYSYKAVSPTLLKIFKELE